MRGGPCGFPRGLACFKTKAARGRLLSRFAVEATVLRRAQAGLLFKQFAEISVIGKARARSAFLERFVRFLQQQFNMLHAAVLEVIAEIDAHFPLE